MDGLLEQELEELAMYRASGLTAVEVNKLVKHLRNIIQESINETLKEEQK